MAITTEMVEKIQAVNSPGGAESVGELHADVLREYVSSSLNILWYNKLYRTLPTYVDDVTRDFGSDLYERMQYDPQVSSCTHIAKMGILAKKGQITPAINDEAETGYKEAADRAAFCRRAIGRLFNFQTHTLYDLLDGMVFGNKVAEVVYRECETGPDKGDIVLDRVKTKDRQTLAYVVDPHLNVTGMLAVIPGVSPTMLSGTIVGNPGELPNILPREKFCIFSYRTRNGDPRGQSIARSAYNAWWLKLGNWPEYVKYLAQFGSPSLWATTGEDAPDTYARDQNGDLVKDASDNPIKLTAEQAGLSALINLRGGSCAVFPFGFNVNAINLTGGGEAFINAFDLLDRQIAKGILCQTLATEEGKHQTRASSAVHQDILGLLIAHGRTCVEEMIIRDLFRVLMRMKYGPRDYEELTPGYSLGDVDQQDFAAIGKTVAALETAGWFTPDQKRDVDAMVGLPARSPDDVAAEKKRLENPPAAGVPGTKPGKPGKPATSDEGDGADEEEE